jgi:hypothetical protein
VFVARQHAERQEDKQYGRPDATRDHSGDDAQQAECAAEQYQLVRLGHRRMAERDELFTRQIATRLDLRLYRPPLAATSKIFAPRSRRVDNTIRRNGRSAKATCRAMRPARREETFGVNTITPMAVGRLAALVVVVLGLIRPTVAQQPSQAQINAIRQACRNDYQTYCASVPTGGSAALACLQQNAQNLSGQCQKAVSAVGGSAPSAQGQRPASPPAPPTPTAPASRTPPPTLSPRQEAMLLRRSCGPDYRAYCSDVPPGGGRIIACLEENGPSLSRQCRSALVSARQGR